jgi:hypothetical protein
MQIIVGKMSTVHEATYKDWENPLAANVLHAPCSLLVDEESSHLELKDLVCLSNKISPWVQFLPLASFTITSVRLSVSLF